jgi:DNA-binding XRE family transcriptional regulator
MTDEAPKEFLDWFNLQLDNRNLGITSAARLIGVSHPLITNIVTYHQKPSCETCFKIADTFHVNREFTLRLAGWLSPISDSEEIINQTLLEMGMVSDAGKRLISHFARFIRQEAEEFRLFG